MNLKKNIYDFLQKFSEFGPLQNFQRNSTPAKRTDKNTEIAQRLSQIGWSHKIIGK